MQQIMPENLTKELIELKNGERLYIDFSEDAVNALEFIQMKRISYENLFQSYINNTHEKANEFNLNSFLEKYVELNMQENDLMNDEIIKIIGFEFYKFIIANKYQYYVDFSTQKLIIYKM